MVNVGDLGSQGAREDEGLCIGIWWGDEVYYGQAEVTFHQNSYSKMSKDSITKFLVNRYQVFAQL